MYSVLLLVLAVSRGLASPLEPGHGDQQRIVNGVEATQGEFPSQLSLRINGSHTCGASILSPQWSLTAAHCVILGITHPVNVTPAEVTFVAGTINVDAVGGTVHQATTILVHELYWAGNSWANDITVIKVSQPFGGTAVQPSRLPSQNQTTAEGSAATVIGWGSTELGGSFVIRLRKVQILVSNQDECKEVYNDLGENVFKTQLCAGVPEGGKGSCNMDSGGPLFVGDEVVGIVSWAYACAEPGYPTVFTRVSSYRTWIKTTTGV